MTNNLRALAESKGREFWVAEDIIGDEQTLEISPIQFTIIDNGEVVFGVTEASHAEKLASALKVAAEVLDFYEKALNQKCLCDVNDGHEFICNACKALTKAKQMLEALNE